MTDYQPLLARALKGLERNSSETRRAVYDRARQALLNQLRSANPPMADADITRERLALEDAIRKTETEAVLAEPHSVRVPTAARPAQPPQPQMPPRPAAREPRIPMPPQQAGAPAARVPPNMPPPHAAPQPRPPFPRTQPAFPGNAAPAPELRDEFVPPHEADDIPFSPEPELPPEFEPAPPLPPPPSAQPRRAERPRPRDFEASAPHFPPPPPGPAGARPRGPRPPGIGPGAAAPVQPAKKQAGGGGKKILLAGLALLLLAGGGLFAFTYRGKAPATPAASPAPAVTDGDQPKSDERIAPGPDSAKGPGAPLSIDPTVAQRAVLYEENPGGGQQFQNFVGTAVWKTEAVNAAGKAPDLGLRIEVEIPDRKINVTLKMRRNTDPSFPASHLVEVSFDMPAGDPFGGVADMRGVRAKGGETAQGNPLAAEVQKVKEGYFLLALPTTEEDNNLSMLRDRDWLDIPFVYANGRRAVLTFQKGTPGERALREVLNSWGKGGPSN